MRRELIEADGSGVRAMNGRPMPRRREVLAAGAAAALGAAGCAAGRPVARVDPHDPGDPNPLLPAPPAIGMSDPGPTPPAAAAERTTILHVVAHPDDDLFFVNPEIQQAIAAGHRVVGVCVTAAESGGRNGPARHADAQGYAKARQNALRAAYGQMVAGDPAARWSRTTLRMPNGALAEAGTLGGVTLVFLNIRKTFWDGRLRNLWTGRISSLPTLVPRGAAVDRHYRYGRTELIDALVHLLHTYRPTLVRTMDPDPDLQVHDHKHPRKTDHGDLSDHEDHTATAQFTWAALELYQGPKCAGGSTGPGGGPHWTAESYRGYYNCRWPANLSGPAWQAKRALLDIYSGDTPVACGDPVGCADLSMRGRIVPSGWGQSTHERYVSTTPWLIRRPSGALAAFAVLDRQAAMWSETGPASGVWSGPVLLGGGILVPRLAVSVLAGGRWQLSGLRIDALGPGERDHRRTIALLEEGGDWQDLGTPEIGAAMRQLGFPVTAHGHVFARTSAKTPAMRSRRADGSWTGWQDLGGPQVQEGLFALGLADGRIELYGLGRLSLVRWFQQRPGGPFKVDAGLRLPPPGTPPAAVEQADGSILLVYRLAQNGQVAGFRLPRGAKQFDAAPVPLGGQGGVGPMQLLPTPDGRVLILQRNDAGTTSTARFPAGSVPAWTPSGPWLVRPAAAALDAKGRVVIAGITPDARLHVSL